VIILFIVNLLLLMIKGGGKPKVEGSKALPEEEIPEESAVEEEEIEGFEEQPEEIELGEGEPEEEEVGKEEFWKYFGQCGIFLNWIKKAHPQGN
jgi:hypothetical protein